MNHAVDGGVLLEDGVERRLVSHVDLVKRRASPTEKLDAIRGDLRGVVEVVDDDDVIVVLEESKSRKGPNVASPSTKKMRLLAGFELGLSA